MVYVLFFSNYGSVYFINLKFSRKWSTSEDVNVKNQVHLYLIFDVHVFRSTPFPRATRSYSTSLEITYVGNSWLINAVTDWFLNETFIKKNLMSTIFR